MLIGRGRVGGGPQAGGGERKGKNQALGPRFYNQPYDMEQTKVQRPLRERNKEHLLQAWQESWHRAAANIQHASLKGLRWGTE